MLYASSLINMALQQPLSIWPQSLIDVVEILHSVQRPEGTDTPSISSGCGFLQVHYIVLFIDFFFFLSFSCVFLCCCLDNKQSIVQGKNTEHVQEDPPACLRKYGYKYNIAFVLFIPWYHQEYIFMGFGSLCRLVHFTNDISREFIFSFFQDPKNNSIKKWPHMQ